MALGLGAEQWTASRPCRSDHPGVLEAAELRSGGPGTELTDQLKTVAYPNGTTTTFSYDGVRRLTDVWHQLGAATISRHTYTLDALGNRTRATEVLPQPPPAMAADAVSYSYDRADRITAAGSTAYTVDPAGNLVARGADAFGYEQANRLTSATVGGTTTT